MAKKYDSLAHTKYYIRYHIVFTPKCRRKIIYNQLRKDIAEYFKNYTWNPEKETYRFMNDLHMIMVPIDFYDVLELVPSEETTMSLNRSYLPINDKNTVIKAIHVMQERYGFTQNFACTLQKHIPTRAGLAGGSADAAAAIRMINRIMKLDLSVEEMIDVAKEVGADVPFCTINRPALVEYHGTRNLFSYNNE